MSKPLVKGDRTMANPYDFPELPEATIQTNCCAQNSREAPRFESALPRRSFLQAAVCASAIGAFPWLAHAGSRVPKAGAGVTLFGLGGAGSNIMERYLAEPGVPPVRTVCINTDRDSLARRHADKKLLLDLDACPESMPYAKRVLRVVAENQNELEALVRESEYVLLCAGLGRRTGVHLALRLTRLAQDNNIPVAAVVSLPFAFEGGCATRAAATVLYMLRSWTPMVQAVSLDEIAQRVGMDAPLVDALEAANSALVRMAAASISAYSDQRVTRDSENMGVAQLRLQELVSK
ncbi:MAG: hypothetical protein F9K47_03070 [Burkholderiales bacterium]|nr:MAG: hypothetical protein F9K47_03070 [Burkholderiales bacterium]